MLNGFDNCIKIHYKIAFVTSNLLFPISLSRDLGCLGLDNNPNVDYNHSSSSGCEWIIMQPWIWCYFFFFFGFLSSFTCCLWTEILPKTEWRQRREEQKHKAKLVGAEKRWENGTKNSIDSECLSLVNRGCDNEVESRCFTKKINSILIARLGLMTTDQNEFKRSNVRYSTQRVVSALL